MKGEGGEGGVETGGGGAEGGECEPCVMFPAEERYTICKYRQDEHTPQYGASNKTHIGKSQQKHPRKPNSSQSPTPLSQAYAPDPS